jgi:hypothetical protein
MANPRQTVCESPISKITRVNWTEGTAQTVEHLLCKHEALSSDTNNTKKKKKEEEESQFLTNAGTDFHQW